MENEAWDHTIYYIYHDKNTASDRLYCTQDAIFQFLLRIRSVKFTQDEYIVLQEPLL